MVTCFPLSFLIIKPPPASTHSPMSRGFVVRRRHFRPLLALASICS
jgi:hypothetical protein